jgi:hypothetical protein
LRQVKISSRMTELGTWARHGKSSTDVCVTLRCLLAMMRTPYRYIVHHLSVLLLRPQTNEPKNNRQWARDRRNAELDRDSDLGPEDMFDAALRGGHRGGNDGGDEFVETMILVVLCLIVSLLLYIRGRWVERLRREEQQQRQQMELEQREERDEVLLRPPGDLARDNWAVPRRE